MSPLAVVDTTAEGVGVHIKTIFHRRDGATVGDAAADVGGEDQFKGIVTRIDGAGVGDAGSVRHDPTDLHVSQRNAR